MICSMIALLLIASPSKCADDTPAAKQYKALLAEFEEEGGARTFAKRFLEFADQQRQDPAAVEALLWVVNKVPGKADTTRALDMLAKRHLDNEQLGAAGKAIAGARSIAAERLLRAMLEKSSHRQVRAQACFHLAALLDLEASLVEQLKAQPELAPRVMQYYGKEYGQHLSSLKSNVLEKERERIYERMLATFADVETQDGKMGEFAEKKLFRMRNLSVGKVAPEIEGEDMHGEKFKLSDYRGRVVMLTFWGHW
jgi:hypothetical protein